MANNGSTQLIEESQFFDEMRAKWIDEGHEGEFAVVRGRALFGFFEGLTEAYNAGVVEFGAGEFLAKLVVPHDDVEVVHRVAWSAFDSEA